MPDRKRKSFSTYSQVTHKNIDVPFIIRVCMDLTMLDVGTVPKGGRRQKQREIIIKLSDLVDPKLYVNHDVMLSKEHRPLRQGKFCYWDDVEIMRYLDELYRARPNAFPTLSAEEFAEYKTEFYANQPIILTLPLKA